MFEKQNVTVHFAIYKHILAKAPFGYEMHTFGVIDNLHTCLWAQTTTRDPSASCSVKCS